jgi:hypothetical protein
MYELNGSAEVHRLDRSVQYMGPNYLWLPCHTLGMQPSEQFVHAVRGTSIFCLLLSCTTPDPS